MGRLFCNTFYSFLCKNQKMKTPFIIALAATAIGFASCQKCTDCECTESSFFDFPATMEQADQDFLESAYITNFDTKSEELCASRGDYDAEVKAWEAQSNEFSETNTYLGEDWSISVTYDCTCED